MIAYHRWAIINIIIIFSSKSTEDTKIDRAEKEEEGGGKHGILFTK